ncbi:MAG: NADH-quinone oxidoreductase subunit J [Bacteroidales bacterium]
MLADVILFYVFAALAVGASLLVIAQRSTIYSVLLLIASFVALAGLYVLLDAPFLAVIQIIIYAGAIMVLFLFVVMLLNAPYETGRAPAGTPAPAALRPPKTRRLGAAIGVALVVELVWTLWRTVGTHDARTALATNQTTAAISSVRQIGRVLYTDYGFAFEVTSVLILVAMVGAVVLAKREI